MMKNSSGEFPISKLLPNIVTIIGLCFGLFALKYAMSQKWEIAVIFIIIAAFIDGLDGRLARMLNASSNFGAQLDSLADFFNFGVAPALILYLWATHEFKALGWAVTLFFIVSQALRLARFNATAEDERVQNCTSKESCVKQSDKFFKGIPAPCGAGLSLMPMMIYFFFENNLGYHPFKIEPLAIIIYMSIIAILMVSTIPTISLKKVKIRNELSLIFLAMFGLLVIALVLRPWIVLPIVGIFYLVTIPFSILVFFRLKKDPTQ